MIQTLAYLKINVILEETNPEIAQKESKTGFFFKYYAKNNTLKRISISNSIFVLNKDLDDFFAQFLKTDFRKNYLSIPSSKLVQASSN
ncbi:hypothetical protein AWN65_07790 [Flavobacterium covae]|nr:hypothetical protein AWN65_07790 [Flavobacterium covae]